MEASVDSGRGSVSLLCCEKLDSCCRAHPDRKLLVDDRVLNNLLQHEDVYRPSMDYFVVQEDIKPYMRKIVSDWMLEVCEEQECPEDLFALAVNLMDRFLCTTSIQKTQFQLLGTTCLYIASKLKMPRPLSAQDLVIYTDQSITLEELKSWELLVLAKLQWDVNAVTGHDFLDYMIHRLSLLVDSEQVRTHAQVFVSLCATDHNFARLPASLIAASSIGAAAHGLYYRSMSGSSAASADSVETNNNHSSKAARRRRSCHEEDVDEEPMDYDDEDIENNPRVAASMSHAPVSLNDSGTSSIHDHDYDDHGHRQSTHRSARNHHASLPSPQRFLEDLLRQLANITCIEMTVLRECVDQIEKLVRLRLSTENEGSSQPKGCGAEAAAAAGGEFTEVGY